MKTEREREREKLKREKTSCDCQQIKEYIKQKPEETFSFYFYSIVDDVDFFFFFECLFKSGFVLNHTVSPSLVFSFSNPSSLSHFTASLESFLFLFCSVRMFSHMLSFAVCITIDILHFVSLSPLFPFLFFLSSSRFGCSMFPRLQSMFWFIKNKIEVCCACVCALEKEIVHFMLMYARSYMK